MIGAITTKPLMVAAGVLLVAVMGLSWGLWSALKANGGLESRNAQLIADAETREQELKRYAELMEAQNKTLTEHRERADKLDVELENAQMQLESMATLGGAISGDFADWLQRAGNDTNANASDNAPRKPASAATNP